MAEKPLREIACSAAVRTRTVAMAPGWTQGRGIQKHRGERASTAAQDVGKAIHPSYVEGQIQGGAVQGIGWALNEEYVYNDEGQMLNASFLDYRMPTTYDVPMIEAVIVEVPNPGHPYGVRGVGEVPIVPPPAAIANAIYQAIGVRMDVLPMSPSRILEAMGTI